MGGFHGTFLPYVGDNAEEVRIEIVDSQGGGSEEIKIKDFRTFTEGQARDPMTIMNPKRAEMIFLIENESMENFITDLATSVADRFVIRATSSSGVLDFNGIITADFIEWGDEAYPFEFRVAAVDGLTRMRDLDFLDDDGEPFDDATYNNWFNCMDLIIKAFNTLNLDQIYGAGDDRFRLYVQMDWSATNQSLGTGSPLETIYIPINLFYNYDNDGNLTAASSYTVVEEILKAFGMRVEYGRGIYKFEQVSSRSPVANSYQAYRWDSVTGTSRALSTVRNLTSVRTDQHMTEAGGSFAILPPLRQVRVSYEYSLFEVATEPDPTYGFGGTTATKVCYQGPPNPDGSQRVGPLWPLAIVTEPPSQVKFRVTFQLMVKTSFSGNPEDFVDHRYRIRVYLAADATQSSGNTSYVYQRFVTGFGADAQEPEWVTGSYPYSIQSTIGTGGYDFMTDVLQFQGAAAPSGYYDVGFETTEYPESMGGDGYLANYICVELVEVITEDGDPLPGTHSIEWAVSDLTVIVAEDNEKAKPTKKEQVFTSRVVNGGKDSRDIKILLGSKGNTVRVYDGSDLVAPNGWGVGTGGGGKELGQLLADEYHKIRGRHIKLMNRGIIGRKNRYNDNFTVFNYCGAYWASMITEHDYYTQTIRGTWWEIEQSYSSPTGVQTLQAEIGKEYNRIGERLGGSPPVLPKNQDVGYDGNGFTAPTNEFVFRDGDLPDKTTTSAYKMNKKLHVYINGNKLVYVEGTPVNTRQFTIDNNNNSIVLDTNFPLSARHTIQVILEHG